MVAPPGLERFGQAELLGIALPGVWRGRNGFVELGILLKEQGRVAAPIPLMHSAGVAAMTIAEFGSDEMKSRVLRSIASGESIVTAALTAGGSFDPVAGHGGNKIGRRLCSNGKQQLCSGPTIVRKRIGRSTN